MSNIILYGLIIIICIIIYLGFDFIDKYINKVMNDVIEEKEMVQK